MAFGDVVWSFPIRNVNARGLGYDERYLYYLDMNNNLVVVVDKYGNEIRTFPTITPGADHRFAFTGKDLLLADPVASLIRQTTPFGVLIRTFPLLGYIGQQGMAYEDGRIWVAWTNRILLWDALGNLIAQFAAPAGAPYGVALIDGGILNTDFGTDLFYLLDRAGNVKLSAPTPDADPFGLIFDGKYAWMLGNVNKRIYQLSLS